MKYDVIIVGGGPAGSTAARFCAGAGLETIIIEKEIFPRVKPCAGGVSIAALNIIGRQVPPDIIESRCSSFHGFHQDKNVKVDMEQEFMVIVSRNIFDMWLVSLAQEAGAEFRQGEEVKTVDIDSQGVAVRTASATYYSRMVIGADGVNSLVSKAVRKPLQKKDLAFCLCSEIDTGDGKNNEPGEIEIHYGPLPMSYGWIFPKRNRLSVGLGGWLSDICGTRQAFESFLAKRGLVLKGKIKGHLIPLGGIARPTVSNRVILAGDAAGYADPFTGEGIRYAVASGKLAAEAVISLIRQGIPLDRQNLMLYEQTCYRQFGSDLKTAFFMARQFNNFPKLLFGIYFSSNGPFEKSLEILQGKLHYRQFFRWLLLNTPALLRQVAVRENTAADIG